MEVLPCMRCVLALQNKMYRSLTRSLLLAGCLFPASLFSQTKIEIVKARDLIGYSATKTNKLIGDVVFRQDDVYLYCDSAILYDEKNSVDAFGHVHVQQGDSLNLYGDFLKYNGNTRQAELFNNIRLIDKTTTLTTSRLNYDLNTNTGYYLENGTIVDGENTLVSRKGYYYASKKEFFFKEEVTLKNPQYIMRSDTLRYNTLNKTAYFLGPTKIISDENLIYCENGWYNTNTEISRFRKNSYILSREQKLKGDSLYYNRKKGIGKAYHNVTITDTIQKLIISGDYGVNYRENDVSVVTGKAMMIKIFEKDSLFLHADTLKSTYDSTSRERKLYAYRKVKFFKTDLRGKCDSMIYSTLDSLLHLYRNPVVWSNQNQLTADSISIQISGNKIDKLYMRVNSFIISQEDSLHFNQVKGKNMTGYFSDNNLYKIRVTGNGQTIYYGRDSNKELMGVNQANCSDILIFLKENKVEKITLIKKPEATFYPIEQVSPNELILKGFKWQLSKQPKSKEDIFIWNE
jgi:lipopolysaccharide export system protein LptA